MSALPVLPGAPRPLVFAHRGLSNLAPENTMAAFALAVRRGVPGIELDVRLTRDGKLAVTHDATTARVAAGQGPEGRGLRVETKSWSELAALDVGSWKGPAWKGERIPLLEELFEEFGDKVYFDIELKGPRILDPGLERAVAAAILGPPGAARPRRGCIVSSFNPLALTRFKAFAPGVPTALIWSPDVKLPFFLRRGQGRWLCRPDCLKPERSLVDPPGIVRGRSVTKPRIAWIVDRGDEARRLMAEGCEGFVSNAADSLVAELGL